MTRPSAGSVGSGADGWGYQLLPRPHPGSPGYSGLLFCIRGTSTETHLGRASMRLQTLGKDGGAHWRTFRLEPSASKPEHVCPNWVVLRDREDKVVEFFTFGGSLQSVSARDKTVYSLRSPAPILQLAEVGETPPNLLAAETEATIAELRAKEADEQDFDRRLAQADPLHLYAAAVDSILKRYRASPRLREGFHELHLMLLEEKDWLQEAFSWPAGLPDMRQILSP